MHHPATGGMFQGMTIALKIISQGPSWVRRLHRQTSWYLTLMYWTQQRSYNRITNSYKGIIHTSYVSMAYGGDHYTCPDDWRKYYQRFETTSQLKGGARKNSWGSILDSDVGDTNHDIETVKDQQSISGGGCRDYGNGKAVVAEWRAITQYKSECYE